MRLGERFYGRPEVIDQALICLLAGGHLLIEDRPGVGKTTLARGLAEVLGLDLARIQFTSDLLPGDILGLSVLDNERGGFVFRPGPIFHTLVMADEINRASPRTQSALLEAMAERQVTIDGQTHDLPQPFHVVATQNPADSSGTFALPDSQLDRFLMRIHLGYPDATAERRLLGGQTPDRAPDAANAVPPPRPVDGLARWQAEVATVHLAAPILDYLLALLERSRRADLFETGLSPRAGMALRAASQAAAWLAGRDHVRPEDIQQVLAPVIDHRLQARDGQASPAAMLSSRVDVP